MDKVDADNIDNVDSFLDELMLSREGEVTTIEEDADNESAGSQKGHFRQTVSAILNQLCFHNVYHLTEKLTACTSEREVKTCMELIYEKAISETKPGVAELCAKLCQVLRMKSNMETVNFRKLLISHCQKEFENANIGNQEQTLVEQEEALTLKKRRLGNIKFIGELYKLEMLTARIMHEIVKKLLSMGDEESLDCLCNLLIIVGRKLDVETKKRLSYRVPQHGLNDLSVYLHELEKIKDDEDKASQIIQDVIMLLTSL